MPKLIWTRNRATGSYTSITGRWIISKRGHKWVLRDSVTEKSYDGIYLKDCQAVAERILLESERQKIDKVKKELEEDLKPVEVSVDTQDFSVQTSPFEGFTPVTPIVLK